MMISFLEYFKGDSIINPRMMNGKDPNRVSSRKNVSTLKKDYKHKHPLLDSIVSGKANNVKVVGQPFLNILTKYDIEFIPNDTKVLGNSDVEVDMKLVNGVKVGFFRNRKI